MMWRRLILIYCIVFSLLFPLIPSTSFIGTGYTVIQYTRDHSIVSNNKTVHESGAPVLVLKVSQNPWLRGVFVGSLSLGIYNGSIWIYSDVYIYNGSRKVYFPLGMKAIELSNRGDYLTDNTVLVIKIPVFIRGVYTSKWPNMIARYGIHDRVYIELPSRHGVIGFFLFYDKQVRTIYHIRYLTKSQYEELIKNASRLGVLFEKQDILVFEREHVSSFILASDLSETIGINMTYTDYLRGISSRYFKNIYNQVSIIRSNPFTNNIVHLLTISLRNLIERNIFLYFRRPPIYMDGGGGGAGNTQPPKPREEYLFNIAVFNGQINYTKQHYNIYIGSNTSDSELRIEYGGLKTPVNLHLNLVLYNTRDLSIIYSKSITLELELGSGDAVIPLNIPYDKKTYRLNITFWSDNPVNAYIYIYLSKDFSGPYDVGETPETKLAYIGYGDYDELMELKREYPDNYLWHISWGLIKGYNTCFMSKGSTSMSSCMDEAIVLAIPPANGLYYYASSSELYLDIVFAYSIPLNYNGGTYVEIYVDDYLIANKTLSRGEDLVRFNIPLTNIKNIFHDAIHSSKPVTLTIRSPLLVSKEVFFTIPYVYFVIPFHPEVWKPRSQNFVSLIHMGSYGGSYIYSEAPDINLQTYVSGVMSYVLGYKEYGIDYSYTKVPVDVLLDVFGNSKDLVTDYGDVVEYNRIVYARLDLWLPKKPFDYSLPYGFQEEILLGKQANKWLTKAVELAEETYKIANYISTAVEILTGGAVLPYMSTVGVIIDTLKASLSQRSENIVDEGDKIHYVLEWRGNAQSIEFGRFRILVSELYLSGSGVIEAKITMGTKETRLNTIVAESRILYGHTVSLEYRSGYAITGYVFVRRG